MGRAALALIMDVFVYGPLAQPDLLRAAVGRQVELQPSTLPDLAAFQLWDGAFACAAWVAGARLDGALCRDLGASELERLDYLALCFGLERGPLAGVQTYRATAGMALGPVWEPRAWAETFAPDVLATLPDLMRFFGERPAAALRKRLPQVLVRGAARRRAAQAAPVTRRHDASAADVQTEAVAQPYAAFFAVEEFDLRHRRFDGGASDRIRRAVFLSGDAVTVLPYDAKRDRVLLIEQFRSGPFARGDRQPWQLEAIAGRIDPGETPEAAARREAEEEAGLALGDLLPVANYYPSPGICAEYLYSFVALCDLPDGIEGIFGMEGEAEDIRGHLIAFDGLMDLIASGEAGNAPLILTALWLQRERARLRG